MIEKGRRHLRIPVKILDVKLLDVNILKMSSISRLFADDAKVCAVTNSIMISSLHTRPSDGPIPFG
jgi:hypothetical protein